MPRFRYQRYIFVWLQLALLTAPGLCWLIRQPGMMSLMQGLIFPIALLTGYVALWGRKLWVGLLFLSPFAVFSPLETLYIALYGHPSDYYLISIVANSNMREVRDFLGAWLWSISALLICCLSIAIQATVAARRQRMGLHTSRMIRLLVAIAPLTFWTYEILIPHSGRSANESSGNADLADRDNNFGPGYPFGIPLRAYAYYHDRAAIRKDVDKLRDFTFGAHATHSFLQRQIYVLLIGESSRRDHWQIFGYEKPTNPELAAAENVVPLPNVVTPWSFSLFAIPVILTPKTGMRDPSQMRTASILRVFSEAGFATYWLSNQLAIGDHDSPISVYAYEADHVQFLNPATWDDPGTYDQVLLPALQNVIESSSGNVFIVLHTMGSHSNYAYRYPPSFDRFQPSSKADPESSSRTELFNSYDNSILYTDHLVAEVIRTLKAANTSSALFYISDHGEDLANDICSLSEHGHASRSNFIVPALFWYSDGYAREFPQRVSNLMRNSRQPLTSENVFESLVDIGDIAFVAHDASRSVFSTDFRRHPRLVNASEPIDIDRAHFSEKCEIIGP